MWCAALPCEAAARKHHAHLLSAHALPFAARLPHRRASFPSSKPFPKPRTFPERWFCARGAGGDSDASRDGIDEREAEENRRFAAAADAVRPTHPHGCLMVAPPVLPFLRMTLRLSGFVAVLMRLAVPPKPC